MSKNRIRVLTMTLFLGLNIVLGLPRSFETMTKASSEWIFTDSMGYGRAYHVATVLKDGEILVSGGIVRNSEGGDMLSSSDVYDPSRGCWLKSDASMSVPRAFHTSSLLFDGKVLVTGGYSCSYYPYQSSCVVTDAVDLYDPIEDTWVETGRMQHKRQMHTASVLLNGKVLVTGGQDLQNVQWNTCELYDPVKGQWSKTGDMHQARAGHTATVLQDGKVLVVGGDGCELYDPSTGNWTQTASMNTTRSYHTATLLMDNQVLVMGGLNSISNVTTASCELYNTSADTWTLASSMHNNRVSFTASLLPNGKVLAVGGDDYGSDGYLSSSELYDPLTRDWTKADDMLLAVRDHIASVFRNGNVLVAGGFSIDSRGILTTTICMLYNSSMNVFTSSDETEKLQATHQIFMLRNEKVLADDEDNVKIANN